MGENNKTVLDRRHFLFGAGAAAATTAFAATLGGCAPSSQGSGQKQELSSTSGSSEASGQTSGYSWEVAPELPAEDEIIETVEADIIVIGAGLAGVSTACKAAENGANVVVVEKGASWSGRGGHFGVFGSRLMKENGLENDPYEVAREWIALCGNRVNEKLVWLFINRSAEAMDWFLDKAEPYGLTINLWDGYNRHGAYRQFPGTHGFRGGPEFQAGKDPGTDVAGCIYENSVKEGVQYYFDTPAEQLVKEGDRVVGCVAKTDDGYIKFVGKNGVVLATGDIGGNEEMCAAYAPLALKPDTCQYLPVGQNTGDGHKMGLWAGGVFEDAPWPTMIHPQAYTFQSAAYLFVNQQGRRFMNEDSWEQAKSLNCMRQPGEGAWALSIWDGNWPETLKDSLNYGGGMFWDSMSRYVGVEWTPEGVQGILDGAVESGMAWKADTLEELADQAGIPKEEFLATVERYNELCAKGVDEDYGKQSPLLYEIAQPPFYALKFGACLLTVPAGLNVNEKLQVTDVQNNPIEGLYAVGNVAGGLYGVDYPILISGNSHGRALTWGYVVGEELTA